MQSDLTRIFTPFLILLDKSGVQILSAILRLCIISLTHRSYSIPFRNAARVSLGIALSRPCCFFVKDFIRTFPDLVRVKGSGIFLNSLLCFLELLRNSLVSFITCSARSDCRSLIPFPTPESACRTRGEVATSCSKDNCSTSHTGAGYASECIRKL